MGWGGVGYNEKKIIITTWLLFLNQGLLCAVQLGRLGKHYSFWNFFCFSWEKNILFDFGNDTENRSWFNSEKNHQIITKYPSY